VVSTVPEPSPSIADFGEGQRCIPREALANIPVAVEVVFAAPAIEAEALRAAVAAAAQHDRAGIAKPDVAERLDDNLGKRAQALRRLSRALMRRDQQDPLALAAGMYRPGEGRNLLLGRL